LSGDSRAGGTQAAYNFHRYTFMRLFSQAKINPSSKNAFTFAEILVALVVVVLFGAAAFTTNQRLLVALKDQKETTAATMVLQQRMEAFRATAFSNVAGSPTDPDYVKNNILLVRTFPGPNSTTINPFEPLGAITEQFTIGVYPDDGSTPTVISWDAQHPGGQYISQNNNLANAILLKVDVLEKWTPVNGTLTGSNGQRSRQLSAIFGKGNVGP
jgi:type II secretory pathway pseudopilin PulG